MLKLARFLKKYRLQVILGPVFKLTEAVFELIVPLVMAGIIDNGINGSDTDYIYRNGALIVLLGVCGLGFALVCQYMASKASQGFGTELRRELFSHINRLSYKELDELGASSLITRLTSDINQLQTAVAMLIRLVVRAPFLVVGATVMAFTIDVKLSMIFLAAIPLIAVTLWLVTAKTIPFYRDIQKKLDKTSRITRENLIGARAVRAFAKQRHETERFGENADDINKTAVRAGKISALLNPATTIILNLAIVAVIWFGGFSVNAGELTQGEIIALVNYMNQILLALIVVSNLVVIFTKSAASAARINEVLNTEPTVKDNAGADIQPDSGAPAIEFDNVSFSYHDNADRALKGISFAAGQGETIGIIGGTGSGKTTLINMIPRFYDVTEGAVKVYGHNVKEYPFRQLRELIGLVPQKAALFSGSLRGNMRWGKNDVSDGEIHRALSIAQAEDFVSQMADGLDSVIMQEGKNLSGGQKQRLTIARALCRDPKILILDDSASALDYATDARLRAAIKENCADMTVIIISQRANTVKAADKIIVLSDGETVGTGTHRELLSSCAEYCEICLSQFSSDEIEKELRDEEQ